MEFVPYNPDWLVAAAKKQHPAEVWLHEALAKCTLALGEEPIIYFVDPKSPDWHVARDFRINDTPRGDVEVDILKDGRVGGIEFLQSEWRSGTFG